MEIFTLFNNLFNIILLTANLGCISYCKNHQIDSEKFTIIFQIGYIALLIINTIVHIAFNYSAIILQFPRL